MGRVRVHNMSVSSDGFGAGAGQDLEHPLGAGGEQLHTWVFETKAGRAMIGAEGGTTFYFVTDGPEAALARAQEAAAGKDVRVGGGVATIRRFLQARLIDDIHVAIVPAILGRGESLFGGIDLTALGYEVVEHTASADVLHVRLSLPAATPR